ncbi:small integral membrane protein 8 [Agrilus planipennis]|uniref:Small integral membrane protein 8 n=1 Tax=Agrilus planipennis TaxID=224129 RepID=A0A1W4XBJ1_AGRPL|nr:small integral membrane protein 8 [Agrilus planipennis]
MTKDKNSSPGDGIRSLRTSKLFRAANFELYVRPNIVIMVLGLIGIAGCSGYLTYMKYKYEKLGYYAAIKSDGTEQFTKKTSRWD